MAVSLPKLLTTFATQFARGVASSEVASRTSRAAAWKWDGLQLKMPGVYPFTSLRVSDLTPTHSVQLPYAGLMVPGMGVSSLTGEPTGAQVVKYEKLQRLTGADASTDGQTSATVIKVVESAEDLFRSVSAALSGGGSYGLFSGSIGADRSEVSKYHSQATTIFASTAVVNGIEYIDGGTLKEEVKELATKNPEEFMKRFGDSYIQGIVRGGYYIATVSITSESRDIQSRIAGSIKASFSGFGGGSGSFSEEMKSYARFSNIDIAFKQRGGDGDDHANLGITLEKLGDKINHFATTVFSHPTTFSVYASPYRSLINFPSESENRIDLSFQRDHLAEYELQRSRILSLRREIEFVQNHPTWFIEPPDTSKLNDWGTKLAKLQDDLENQTRKCMSDAEKCTTSNFILPADIKIPVRKDDVIDREESSKLGTVWEAAEGDWNGIWRRVGRSKYFEAEWILNRPSVQAVEKALLEIRMIGDTVEVLRVNSHGTANGASVTREGECHYIGTLQSDGKTVSGTYSCPWGSHKFWRAKINY